MTEIDWERPEVEAEFRRLYQDGWERGARSARNGAEQCEATAGVKGSDRTYRCHRVVGHDGMHEDPGGHWRDAPVLEVSR